jgi:hypothetical protein
LDIAVQSCGRAIDREDWGPAAIMIAMLAVACFAGLGIYLSM